MENSPGMIVGHRIIDISMYCDIADVVVREEVGRKIKAQLFEDILNTYPWIDKFDKVSYTYVKHTDTIEGITLTAIPAKPEEPKLPSKFKNAEALLEAYQSLEKDYTKKCQRLKELERKLGEGQ